MSRHLLALILVGSALLGGAPHAQAQFKGAWLPDRPSLTIRMGIQYSATDAWFCGPGLAHCQAGERTLLNPLASSQESRLVTPTFELELVPVRGLDLIAFFPVHFLQFTETTAILPREISADGLGDITVMARAGVVTGNWAFSGGYGLEFPTGSFTTSAFEITVGRGTRNHLFLLEAGWSLYPKPAYLQAGLLVRLRETLENEFGVRIDWGNEVGGRLEAGFQPTPRLWLIALTEAMKSGVRRTNTGEQQDQFQSLWSVAPKAAYRLGKDLWIDAWVVFPLAGRNMPADPALGTKLSVRFDILDPSRPKR